jgi:hypothetical protein
MVKLIHMIDVNEKKVKKEKKRKQPRWMVTAVELTYLKEYLSIFSIEFKIFH